MVIGRQDDAAIDPGYRSRPIVGDPAGATRGPYRLGGYRNGALVALQAARLLVAAGHEVALVALVDPPTITAYRPVQFLLSLVGRIARKQAMDGHGEASMSRRLWRCRCSSSRAEYEGRAWRRVSADVELIDCRAAVTTGSPAMPRR